MPDGTAFPLCANYGHPNQFDSPVNKPPGCDCPAHSNLDAVAGLAGGDLQGRAEQQSL